MAVAVVPLDEPQFALDELEFALKSGAKLSGLRIVPPAADRPATSSSIRSGRDCRNRTLPSSCTSAALPCNWTGHGRTTAVHDRRLDGRRREPPHQGRRRAARGPGNVPLDDARSTACSSAFPSCAADVSSSAPDGCRRCSCGWTGWPRFGAGPTPTSRASRASRQEQLTQQMAFTPFVFEEVGALIDQSNPDLYLFSTDYPHTEGGRNPIARFETSLGTRPTRFAIDSTRRIFCDLSRSAGLITPRATIFADSGGGPETPPPLLLQCTSPSISIRLARGSDASGGFA